MLRAMFFVISLIFVGCGDDDSSNSSSGEDSFVDSASVAEETTNPIARSTEMFGSEGNLWKPHGDDHGGGPGNLVILLSSKFTEQFDSCEVRLHSGEVAQLTCINNQPWTQIPFSCFSNGNRQTWRANFGCSSAAEVRVVCRDFNQEIEFTVPEAVRNQVCNRWG